MMYPDSITQAEKHIDETLEFFQKAKQEVQEIKDDFQKYNRKIPRKQIAKLLGCTPEHVSRLKAEGKLKSYNFYDVRNYMEERGLR